MYLQNAFLIKTKDNKQIYTTRKETTCIFVLIFKQQENKVFTRKLYIVFILYKKSVDYSLRIQRYSSHEEAI